jgi:hypothetical protein
MRSLKPDFLGWQKTARRSLFMVLSAVCLCGDDGGYGTKVRSEAILKAKCLLSNFEYVWRKHGWSLPQGFTSDVEDTYPITVMLRKIVRFGCDVDPTLPRWMDGITGLIGPLDGHNEYHIWFRQQHDIYRKSKYVGWVTG